MSTRKARTRSQGSTDTGTAPAKPEPDFAVVGVGASAGGLEALYTLLEQLPPDTGAAFVVIQHLPPRVDSKLPELLGRRTAMTVAAASDDARVEPDRVYVIPPGYKLGIHRGRLQLIEYSDERLPHLPIDFFFCALARDCGERAVGVLLSGSGSDGTVGLKAIKAAGGITLAQDEATAMYADMPASAMASGSVDVQAPPAQIAREIARLAENPLVRRGYRADAGLGEHALERIFFLLRERTGHEFADYKPSTITRRIQRRMVLHKLERVEDYLRLLEQTPIEVDALFEDLLINVTEFFRDPASFQALAREVFPKLLEDRQPQQPLRIWVPACASGEEAYSVAIALAEFLGEQAAATRVQIYATDIDHKAIAQARAGVYSADALLGRLSPERLQRFFIATPQGYQISRTLRAQCVFAVQDITRDPPFSQVDLVCCRNLLIYLGPELQSRVLAVLHFALKPGGFLMLSPSETAGSAAGLFEPVDMRNKIYQKRPNHPGVPIAFRTMRPPAVLPGARVAARDLQREAEQLLASRYAPPGVIVSEDLNIAGFLGDVARYVSPAAGAASFHLLRMVHRDLMTEVQAAVRAAVKDGAQVRREGVRLREGEAESRVNVAVLPMQPATAPDRYYLVAFEPAPALPSGRRRSRGIDPRDQEIEGLRRERDLLRGQMQSLVGDEVTAREELQGAYEELQSSNEELQSTNEELESTKEELQSTNEELATINDELARSNAQLAEANSDLANLHDSIDIPLVMLDGDLRLRLFSPAARGLLNLIDGDLGRPLTDLNPTLRMPELAPRIRQVIRSDEPAAFEAQDAAGRWYSVRIHPYRDGSGRSTGAVLAFVEVTRFKQEAVQASRLVSILRDSADAILLLEPSGRILEWNEGAQRLYGYSAAEAVERNIALLDAADAAGSFADAMAQLAAGEVVAPLIVRRQAKSGALVQVQITAASVRNHTGEVVAITSTERLVEP